VSANVPRPPAASSKSSFPIWIVALVGCLVAMPVLVAVVGIVAAIAIPNFIKFQCKAKQSEARVNLTGLFIAEKAFYGEYDFYTTDLQALNWQPDGSPIYLYGFVEAGPYRDGLRPGATLPTDYDPERMDTSDPSVFTSPGYKTDKMRDQSGYALSPQDLPSEAVVASDGSTFKAAAIADISGSGYSQRFDVWTIDENKTLTNTENDCGF
jgi:type IV pilus assembly protein PilA